MKKLFLTFAACSLASISQAAIIQFNLIGTGGVGLLPGNEPGAVTGGTGGEILGGISYDDVANLLTLNVGWGSANGFANLSSLATNSHIHGPTANNNGNNGTADFTQTANVLFNLTRSSNAVTGGVFTDPPIAFTAGQETDLLNGKFYINIHTATNGGGELRGFLTPVPEPATALFGVTALGALALRRRRA